MAKFNQEATAELSKEAFENRMRFIERVHSLFDIALNANHQQYALMKEARERGDASFDFEHFILSSDSDEKQAQLGYTFKPTFYIKMEKNDDVTPQYQASQTLSMMLALPVRDGMTLSEQTTIDDVLEKSDEESVIRRQYTVYVSWTIKDVTGIKEELYEVSVDGIRKVIFISDENEADEFARFVSAINAQNFSILETGDSLVARFRQDLRNLHLVSHSHDPIELTSGTIELDS